MNTQIMTVSPEMASDWLAKNSRNRVIRQSLVDAYVSDMKNGKWECTHQGIAFYDDGILADGQHRLTAILQSGISVLMQVTFGISRDAGIAIDMQAKRTVGDAMAIAGHEEITNKKVETINAFITMFLKQKIRRITPNQVLSFYTVHQRAIEQAIDITGSSNHKMLPAVVRAAFLSACMSGENDDLMRLMVASLKSGVIDSKSETAAIRLREYLMREQHSNGIANRLRTYRISEKAIKMFCSGQEVKLLRPSDSLIYVTSIPLSQYGIAA